MHPQDVRDSESVPVPDPAPAPPAPPTAPTTDRRALLAGIGGLAAGALLAGTRTAHAGPLDPPAGAVAATPGPEPRIAINATNTPGTVTAIFRITQPGSYYLTGNLTGEPGKNGIEIAASNVTVDLMGFVLQGAPGSGSAIRSDGEFSSITVVNGSIRAWDVSGILLNEGFSRGARIDRVRVFSSGSAITAGQAATVTNCYAENSGTGIKAGQRSKVLYCTVDTAAVSGISVDSDSTVQYCTVVSCQNGGIRATDFCLVSRCIVTGNGTGGILVGSYCIVADCTANSNLGFAGISVIEGSLVKSNICAGNGSTAFPTPGLLASSVNNRIEANHSIGNRIGIQAVSGGNVFARNTCSGSGIRNWDLVGNNTCFVVAAATSGVISGVAGGVSPGSSDPNANFSF